MLGAQWVWVGNRVWIGILSDGLIWSQEERAMASGSWS